MAFESRQEILNLVSPCGTHLNDDVEGIDYKSAKVKLVHQSC